MTQDNATAKPSGFMNIEELARYLNITVRHVRRFVAERTIPAVKIGGAVRFDPKEIDKWIDERRRPAREKRGPWSA